MNLIIAKNHVELYVIQTSNNFGDQFLEYVFEALDGSKLYSYSHHFEGNWLTTKKQFLDEYKTLLKFNHEVKNL